MARRRCIWYRNDLQLHCCCPRHGHLRGLHSRRYYDSDALAIWEIFFYMSMLLPSWLALYRRLRSITALIVLRLWGGLMFIGGVGVVC